MAVVIDEYDPEQVILNLGGIPISGFGEDNIEIKYNDEDDVKEKVGFQGDHGFTENLDKSGTLKFTLKQAAMASIRIVQGLKKGKTKFPVFFKDTSGSKKTVVSDGARIKNRPATVRGKEEEDIEVIVAIPRINEAEI